MTESNDPDWPMLMKELAEKLGVAYGTIVGRRWRLEKTGELCKDTDFIWDASSQGEYRITLAGAIKIAQHLRSSKAAQFLESQNIVKLKKVRIEYAHLDNIEDALAGIAKCVRHRSIRHYVNNDYYNKFDVDMWIPEYAIAVECDENGHADRDAFLEAYRESVIKGDIKCEFIRFNPDAPDFSIGKVINQIFKIILSRNAERAEGGKD